MSAAGLRPDECAPGTKVRLTGRFLACTGQQAGGEGQSRWIIVACDCSMCREHRWVATNEPHSCQEDPTGYEDLAPEDRPKWRHIAAANLETVGGKPKAADYEIPISHPQPRARKGARR